MDRLDGLSDEEKAACVIAERSLGVTAEAWDILGRPSAVDAMLTYPDGRRAAFEVTSLAAENAQHTDSLLTQDDHRWPLEGKWWWTINVGSPSDFERLKRAYQKIIALCEAQNVPLPKEIGWAPDADPDLRWLVQDSVSEMVGHPDVPAVSYGKQRQAMVVPQRRGGFVDENLTNLADALKQEFDSAPHIPRHFNKLKITEADERHLFVPLHFSALPESEFLGLVCGDSLPPSRPVVPEFLTHLWLAPMYTRRVLLWDRMNGWRNFYPYEL